jgi:minichromosome maintenance protein 10
VQSSRKEIELGPRPGQRIRSGVVVPSNLSATKNATASIAAEATHDLDDSDGELERGLDEINMLDNMVDLDGSSDVEDRS